MKLNSHKSLLTSLAVAVVISAGALASDVTIPNSFQANTTAVASQVNANFVAVKTAVDDNFSRITALAARVTTLEGQQGQQGGQHLYAVQTSDLFRGGANSDWADVPGASVTFSTSGSATPTLMTASGVIFGGGGASGVLPWSRCAMRFLVDGSPIQFTDPVLGNMTAAPGEAINAPAESLPFTMIEKLELAAGSHTIKVQMSRVAIANRTTGDCTLLRWTFARTRLLVDTY